MGIGLGQISPGSAKSLKLRHDKSATRLINADDSLHFFQLRWVAGSLIVKVDTRFHWQANSMTVFGGLQKWRC